MTKGCITMTCRALSEGAGGINQCDWLWVARYSPFLHQQLVMYTSFPDHQQKEVKAEGDKMINIGF